MATATRSGPMVEIERLGFEYTEEPQYALEELVDPTNQRRILRRVQVRESEHYAPKDQVERYAIQMGQSTFPPVIVTEDGYVVDGNTRIAASLMRGQKFFPAVVLRVSYGRANPKRQSELKALAATLNAQNGQPLTPRERRATVEDLISLNWKNDQIGRAIGLGTAAVTQVKQEMDAVTRLRRVGIGNGHLKGASLRALGKAPVLSLNDEPFHDLALLAEEAGLNATEIIDFAKQAKATGSDEGAKSSLNQLREEMQDRIRENGLTGASKPPAARQLRQHLGFVLHYVGEEAALCETNPTVAPQHLDVVEAAIKVLEGVRDAQRARG